MKSVIDDKQKRWCCKMAETANRKGKEMRRLLWPLQLYKHDGHTLCAIVSLSVPRFQQKGNKKRSDQIKHMQAVSSRFTPGQTRGFPRPRWKACDLALRKFCTQEGRVD